MNDQTAGPYALSPLLASLAAEEVDRLIARYYAGENVAALMEEYHLPIAASQLVACFPPTIHPDRICCYCGAIMISRRPARSVVASDQQSPKPYCPNCSHIDSPHCQCPECRRRLALARQAEEEKKRFLVNKTYSLHDNTERRITTLTLRERVLLGALVRNGLDENLARIKPLCEQKAKLSPRKDYDMDILRSLYATNAILVHPASSTDAFCETENSPYPDTFDLSKVCFHINVETYPYPVNPLHELAHPAENAFDNYSMKELHAVWKEIAFEECLEYLENRLTQVGFPVTVGKKTAAIFNDLLDHFSTAQIFGIIYKSIANASTSFLEKNLSRQHAANLAIHNCQSQGDRYLANNWEITGFHRDYKCPQSTLSSFLYDRVMKIGNKGFTLCPIKALSV